MLNKVVLIGRLTANIELRKTGNDIPFTYFTIAVNRQSQTDKTDFISCVAWRQTAELMNRFLTKGSLIAIEGRLEVFRKEKDNNYETNTTVNVQTVNFLEKKSTSTTETKMDFANPSNVEVKFGKESNEDISATSEIDFDSIKF